VEINLCSSTCLQAWVGTTLLFLLYVFAVLLSEYQTSKFSFYKTSPSVTQGKCSLQWQSPNTYTTLRDTTMSPEFRYIHETAFRTEVSIKHRIFRTQVYTQHTRHYFRTLTWIALYHSYLTNLCPPTCCYCWLWQCKCVIQWHNDHTKCCEAQRTCWFDLIILIQFCKQY
jgi:hypothetical protein